MNTSEILNTLITALDAQRAVLAEALRLDGSRGAPTAAALHATPTLVGQRFGDLTVIARAPSRLRSNGKPRAYWHCRCSCGAPVDVRADHLRNGSKSCGHLSRAAQFTRRAAEQRTIERGAKRHATRGVHARAQANEFAERLRPLIAHAVNDGCPLTRIADRLNAAGTRPRHSGRWTANAVYGVLCRLGLKTRRAKTEQRTAPAIKQGASAPASANTASTIEQGEAPRLLE